jgi:hypothetical protein
MSIDSLLRILYKWSVEFLIGWLNGMRKIKKYEWIVLDKKTIESQSWTSQSKKFRMIFLICQRLESCLMLPISVWL